MAFQTSSAATATTTASSSQTASGGTGVASTLNGNSSLPFSFLITFIAVFLFFLGCGLGSRRVTSRLRRNLQLQITPVEASFPAGISERPLLWDVHLCDPPLAVQSQKASDHCMDRYAWENLSPLSATYVRTPVSPSEREAEAHPELEPPPPIRWGVVSALVPGRGFMRSLATTPSLARPPALHSAVQGRPRPPPPVPEVRWRGHLLPESIARLLLPPTALPDDANVSSEEHELDVKAPIRALEVAVVISMPSLENSRRRTTKVIDRKMGVDAEIEELEVSGGQGMGDYVLGFARVPWEGELQGTTSTKATS
ncbi:hypothetical protein BD414DRAFT_525183 [Trametes punicea]|nr:hypothetical protein BD414DRAFT_525183 [Trametes punicea]